MIIIYALVARGTLVLAEYTSYDGDFPQFARKVIAKSPRNKSKKTFTKENLSFTFFSDDEFTFLCLTSTSVPRETSYKFLDTMASEFFSDYYKQGVRDANTSWAAKFSIRIKELMVHLTFELSH